MLSKILKKLFGSRNDRLLRDYGEVVSEINGMEHFISELSDDSLRKQTEKLKNLLDKNGDLDQILPEAFATVREASKRTLGMRHFDVQLIGGMALHEGKIAEMRTGEGKTLAATLPAYLNALTGGGVHVVTVNDYLARRDADWMGKIYTFLGLSVGVNLPQTSPEKKREAYNADITYGTNNEFGFDYLRDNMVFELSERVQRPLSFAIVDEVDSILIDEARTPLIISGQADDSTELYKIIDRVAPKLIRGDEDSGSGDYYVDEKSNSVLLTELGHDNAEKLLSNVGVLPPNSSLYDASNISLIHHLYASLKAHNLFLKDQHYVVQNGEIVIVDEFTGRLMSGRRWSDGLHQAVEAKERVSIQKENQTLASVTFQNYFRIYDKLGGMTGTADTEAFEFQQIYGLETVIVPTHQNMVRVDHMDKVYRTSDEKYNAIIDEVLVCHEKNQPVLVGTTSIENSELLSIKLKKAGLKHQVLNAKQHAQEAEIITQAGRPKMITIATNMAGRGTDIVLGGNPEPQINSVLEDHKIADDEKSNIIEKIKTEWSELHRQVVDAGGLHIIGTERHESRRVDNQLRGRSGRQGDPGSSRFFLGLEDPLLRIFASDRVSWIMERLKMPEGEAIEHKWVTKAIENAQRKVESRNFDIRKQLLEYDDVANDQRQVIYDQRNEILSTKNISEMIEATREGALARLVYQHVPDDGQDWDLLGLDKNLKLEFDLKVETVSWVKEDSDISDETLLKRVIEEAHAGYLSKFEDVPLEVRQGYERAIMLQSLDGRWREHLSALDQLRQGIHLRGYAAKNPKQEYKKEAFALFSILLELVRDEVSQILMKARITSTEEAEAVAGERGGYSQINYQHDQHPSSVQPLDEKKQEQKATPFVRGKLKVGRNEPCPCGSGKKYKQCCGRAA